MTIKMSTMKDRLLSCVLFSLLCGHTFTGIAQEQVFKEISQQFEKNTRYNAVEKIYLHTDKNFYLAGEIIWFKIYNVDGIKNQSANLSKIAYVELLDRSHKPVLQAKIDLSEKGGAGSFYLPLTLSSDNYTVRAYTNWMKNSGAATFFEKFVGITNTIKPSPGRSAQDSLKVTASFFPEGGNMVQGIETKVAFHIADEYGKGVDVRGIVTDDRGDTVINFSPYRFGIGNFSFKPLAGRAYKATILLNDGKYFTNSLPAVYQNGYVMNVTDNKDGRIKIRVQARSKEQETGQRGENVFLMAHTRQQLKAAEYGFINYETDLVFYIDKTKLAGGISHFTLFNKDRQPVCERLVFTKPMSVAKTNLNIEKAVYEKRQKVDLSVSDATEKSKMLAEGNYSVAVYQVDSIQLPDDDNIDSYLWLTSDLSGHVESPAFYFSDDANVQMATDNLLLTHGWRRFRWENILSLQTAAIPAFMPEYRWHVIAARVTNIADGTVAPGVDCFISFPATPFGLSVAKTDSKGIAYFEVKNYFGPGEIIVQAGRDIVTKYRVDVLTPFAEEDQAQPLPFLLLGRKEEAGLVTKSIAMQAQNIYVADSIRRFKPPVLADTFAFFGKPEQAYRLDDYKRFTTMEEVLREYVTSINVVLRNGKLYLSVYDEALQSIYTDETLVLLDGVPLMDYQKIFSYDPLKVKKLEIVPRRYILGGINYKGIASFETYQGKFDGFEMTPGLIAVDYEGLQLQREFYSPVYETSKEKEKRIPDYRSTLYWAPEVKTDKAGKASLQFYTADLPGKFLVVLQGFNAKGEATSASGSFTVQ